MKKIDLIGLCIDVRNSTKMIAEFDLKETFEIISSFITDIYKILNKPDNKIFKDRSIHQGDGVIITMPLENDEKFKKTLKLVIDLEKIIKRGTKPNFKIGMSLDFDNCIEGRVKETPYDEENLIIGNSISRATKICSQVPFKRNLETFVIKASKEFVSKSKITNDERFKVDKNAKGTMYFIAVK